MFKENDYLLKKFAVKMILLYWLNMKICTGMFDHSEKYKVSETFQILWNHLGCWEGSKQNCIQLILS